MLHDETEANARHQEAREQMEAALSNMGKDLEDLTQQHHKARHHCMHASSCFCIFGGSISCVHIVLFRWLRK